MRKLYFIGPHHCFIGDKSNIVTQSSTYIVAPPDCFKGNSKLQICNKPNSDIKNKCKISYSENKHKKTYSGNNPISINPISINQLI